MATKQYQIIDLGTAAVVNSGTLDAYAIEGGWFYSYDEATGWYQAGSDESPLYNPDKIIVSPIGVAYPGDATPGNGHKQVVIVGSYSVTLDRCENAEFIGNWLVVTKGDHILCYRHKNITIVTIKPAV